MMTAMLSGQSEVFHESGFYLAFGCFLGISAWGFFPGISDDLWAPACEGIFE